MSEVRPPYRQPALLVLVLLGGAAGTTARWGTGLVVPHVLRLPLGTLAVNVVGAFVLGVLLERVGGRRPALRATLGTGFCGGFTTYSALANDAATLLREGLAGRALAYVGATLVLGFVSSVLGSVLARRRPGRPA